MLQADWRTYARSSSSSSSDVPGSVFVWPGYEIVLSSFSWRSNGTLWLCAKRSTSAMYSLTLTHCTWRKRPPAAAVPTTTTTTGTTKMIMLMMTLKVHYKYERANHDKLWPGCFRDSSRLVSFRFVSEAAAARPFLSQPASQPAEKEAAKK